VVRSSAASDVYKRQGLRFDRLTLLRYKGRGKPTIID
jgi:hypothetical protein